MHNRVALNSHWWKSGRWRKIQTKGASVTGPPASNSCSGTSRPKKWAQRVQYPLLWILWSVNLDGHLGSECQTLPLLVKYTGFCVISRSSRRQVRIISAFSASQWILIASKDCRGTEVCWMLTISLLYFSISMSWISLWMNCVSIRLTSLMWSETIMISSMVRSVPTPIDCMVSVLTPSGVSSSTKPSREVLQNIHDIVLMPYIRKLPMTKARIAVKSSTVTSMWWLQKGLSANI